MRIMYNKKYIDFKKLLQLLQTLHPYSDKVLRCNSWFFILLQLLQIESTYQQSN
jgi:hypothetical protein